MHALKDSRVGRCGATKPQYDFETSEVEAEVGAIGMRLLFSLSAAGGGRTYVRLTIGNEDLPLLLRLIAEEIPEAHAWMAQALANALAGRADSGQES